MASNEVELLDPAEIAIEQIKKIASGRALNRRNFLAALGVGGAVSGAALVSRSNPAHPDVVEAAGPSQTDVLNFALNLEYLEATFYSYITQGTDLPASLTAGSGAITGNPTAKLVFTGPNAAQITDLLNEIYYDELSHVSALLSVLGPIVAVPRPPLNLAAYGTITASNALSIARLFEDVGVTAYAGAAAMLSGANLTYAAQILAVEGFHSGALRLVAIQNPTIAQDFPPGGNVFQGTTTANSNVISNVYFSSVVLTTGQGVVGIGIPIGATITAISPTTSANISITGTLTKSSTTVTAVSSVAGLAVGQLITGTNITAGTTITAVGTTTITLSIAAAAAATAQALVVGGGTITLSTAATSTVVGATIVGLTGTQDVNPADPGTPALAAAGPTTTSGFFNVAGGSNANALTPAGLAFARTTSQVLAIVYASNGIPAYANTTKGGFFPGTSSTPGFNGVINTV